MMTTMTNMFEEGEVLLTAPMMATWFYVDKVDEEAAFSMSLALMYLYEEIHRKYFLIYNDDISHKVSVTMVYMTMKYTVGWN